MKYKNERGRSMVEMLGVLAIIGVLSAGVLKGYSAAMFKYKMNQTIDTYNQVLQRFMELEQKGLGQGVEIGNDGNGAQDFVTYGLLPNCQKETAPDGTETCRLPVGTIGMSFVDTGSFIFGQFIVFFTDSKSCITFASAGWENASPVEWWTYPYDPSFGGFIQVGSEVIYWPVQEITEVKMSDIIEGCQICETDLDRCFFYHAIRGEL